MIKTANIRAGLEDLISYVNAEQSQQLSSHKKVTEQEMGLPGKRYAGLEEEEDLVASQVRI